MDSMMDYDPTLPIDFDQTSNFARFLDQSRKDSMQSDITVPESKLNVTDSDEGQKENKKKRSYSANDQPPERPLSRGGTLREQENIVSDLKKECFGLKMRIYFMEEQLHEACNGDTEATIKKNIELKVTIEEIKHDLDEKSNLLKQASQAMEQLSLERDNDIKELEKNHKRKEQKEKDEFQSQLKQKDDEIQKMQSEVEALRINVGIKEETDRHNKQGEHAENLMKLKESKIEDLQKKLLENDHEMKILEKKKKKDEDALKSMISKLEETVSVKDANIQSLKKNLEKLAHSPERSSQHYRKLYESQGQEITEKDQRINDLVKDLASKTNLTEGLKEHVVAMEKSIKGMRSNLHEKEMDKQRVVSQLQEKLKINEKKCNQKDQELAEKSNLISTMKDNMKKLSQQRVQFQLDSTRDKDARIIELDVMMKQQKFDLEKLKSLLDEKDKEIVFFGKKNLDLEEKWKTHHESSQIGMQQFKKNLNDKLLSQQKQYEDLNEKYHVLEDQYKHQIKRKDKTIQALADAIKDKDAMIEDLAQIAQKQDVEQEDDSSMKDQLIEKLQGSLRKKDRELEDKKEEYFNEAQNQDNELMEMKRVLREKITALKKNNAEIASLKLRIKGLERNLTDDKDIIDKLKMSLEKSMENERNGELISNNMLLQKEQEIRKLSALLDSNNKQLQDVEKLSRDLLSKMPSETDTDELNRMLNSLGKNATDKEVVSSIGNLHELIATEVKNQELLSMLKKKENQVKELFQMLQNHQEEKKETFIELNEKLLNTEQEVKELSSALLALKDVQQKEIKAVEETISNKDKIIEDLVKSGKEKDRIIVDLKENSKVLRSSSPTKSAEINKLRDLIDELRSKMDAKQEEKQALRKEVELLNSKLNEASGKSAVDENFKNQVEKLEDLCHTLEDEKIQLQAELGLVKLSKESLQSQLEGAQNRKSRQGTPVYKETLIEELEDLVKAAEKEKAKYQTLSEKLQNNQHPESCLKMLKNEITEVEHLRRNLQGILLNVLKKQPEAQSLQEQLVKENEELKEKLEREKMRLPDMSSVIKEAELENQSLKNDLKRCELEAKQLNSQLDSIKIDYEQMVHERDREITHMTTQLQELDQDKKVLIKQRDQAKEDLMACRKQLDLLNLRVNEQVKKNKPRDEMDPITKEKETVISSLQKEKGIMKKKLEEAETDMKHLNDTLQRMREIDMVSLESRQSSALEEKKQLKRDAKELCNINDRLRSKLKDLTKSYETLKREKDTEQNKLLEEIQKARSSIRDLEADIQNRQWTFDSEKISLEQQVEEKTNFCDEVQNKYSATLEENTSFQRKIEELVKVNEVQQSLTAPELQQLRDEVLSLTKENNQLKIKKLEYDGTRKETKTLASALEESKHRNKALQEELSTRVTDQRQLQNKVEQMQFGLTSREENVKHVEKLESDLYDLRKLKELLERQLKEFSNSAKDIKEQLNRTREEVNAKDMKIASLQSKINDLARQCESFSPLQTSSQRNLAPCSDASTQTKTPFSKFDGQDFQDNSLIAMHIQEMRELRKQLEETRKNNDALRQQLEDRLSQVEKEAQMMNDPQMKVTLIRDNDVMRVKLTEAEANQHRMKIRIDELITEKQSDKVKIDELHLQLHELNEMSIQLKLEMEAYDRLVKQFGISRQKYDGKDDGQMTKEENDKLDKHLLKALLEEIRDLRGQLTKSIDVNIALREQLEKELGRPVSITPLVTPSKDATMSAKRSLFSAVLQSVSIQDGSHEGDDDNTPHVHFGSPFETPTKDYCVSRDGTMDSTDGYTDHTDCCVLFGTWSSYRMILDNIKLVLSSLGNLQKKSVNEKPGQKSIQYPVRDLNNTLKKLKELNRLIHAFIPQDHKQNNLTEQNIRLRKDIARLKKVLSSKEHFIQSALKMVEENALWRGKKVEDTSITKKLMKTRDTLKATKGNLEKKARKAQELDVSFNSSTSFEEPKSPIIH